MSWLYTVPEGLDGFVNVRSSMFEKAGAHRPFVEMWTCEALPGAQSGAPRQFATAPDESQFGELMAAYAAWDGRVNA